MSNQRAGKFHSAGLDDTGGSVSLKSLIKFATEAQFALEQAGEDDAALRFEIFADYLSNDVAAGKPFVFSTKALGL